MAPLLADGARQLQEQLLQFGRRARLMAAKYPIMVVIATWVQVMLKKLLRMLFTATAIHVQMLALKVIHVFKLLFLGRLIAERQPVSEACSSLETICSEELQRPITGSNRGLRQTQQHVGDCRSSISGGPSKRGKRKQVARLLIHKPEETRPGDSGGLCSVSAETTEDKRRKKAVVTGWDSLPYDIQENILQRVEFRDLFRLKVSSKSWKTFIESNAFSQLMPSESSLTAINYYIKDKVWQCIGFDLHSKSWKALPPFSCLSPPDAALFKEYSVCGHGGLMCADVSKNGELVVFNPLTSKARPLPPLLHSRNPVLVHISVNSAQKSYKVIVAGSSTTSDEHLSKRMDVYDSSTSEWKEACDLPGPAFGLNEHQAGVCLNGTLFFISFLEGDSGRGVVAFDVENGKWLENRVCPIPFSSYSNTLQLVENDGKLYLFSEQEQGESVEHCIDVLEFSNAGAMGWHWRNVVRVRKLGGEELAVYPELLGYFEDFTCVGFGEGKLLIFNTLSRDGVVYDMRDGKQLEVLEPPPLDLKGDSFSTLNPASFTLQPIFDSDPNFSMATR